MFVFGVHHWHQRVEFLCENFCSRVLFASPSKALLEAPDLLAAQAATHVLLEDGFAVQVDCDQRLGYTVLVTPS